MGGADGAGASVVAFGTAAGLRGAGWATSSAGTDVAVIDADMTPCIGSAITLKVSKGRWSVERDSRLRKEGMRVKRAK